MKRTKFVIYDLIICEKCGDEFHAKWAPAEESLPLCKDCKKELEAKLALAR